MSTRPAALDLRLDRHGEVSLAAQIHAGIRSAIRDGRLQVGARLPSWRDLATQLGVARGTVRVAYERLIDEHLIVAEGAAGTRVANIQAIGTASPRRDFPDPHPQIFHGFGRSPLPFQNGVPAEDAFPYGVWSKLLSRAARTAASSPVGYPDPRGCPELRHEIAAYLAIARGLHCDAAQVIVTAGFSGALGLLLASLALPGRTAWFEEPGFPLTRIALETARIVPVPIPVDEDGLNVAIGIEVAPEAALAVVTPGQHAPLGHVMSRERRLDLIAWAAAAGAWIIEDDYLGELQMSGRAAPALMSLDPHGRVIHVGTFSKTISPALRLGFVVLPPDLVSRVSDAAAVLAPAPMGAGPLAVAAFIGEGHYLRHLRRMKRLYAERRDRLAAALAPAGDGTFTVEGLGGFAVRIMCSAETDDVAVAKAAAALGLSPVPLSPWYLGSDGRKGLLLGFSNLFDARLGADCRHILELVRRADALNA